MPCGGAWLTNQRRVTNGPPSLNAEGVSPHSPRTVLPPESYHNLPKLSGFKLIRKLRAARMALPVIMVADGWSESELARSPSLHLSALLLKPISIGALMDTVDIVLCAANRLQGQIAARASIVTHVLQEGLDRCHACVHWGLNE